MYGRFQMKYIAFTGTRYGITPAQLLSLEAFLPQYHQNGYETLVHGACEGADRAVHLHFRRLFAYDMWPSNQEQLGWALAHVDRSRDTIQHTYPPLERNEGIVDTGNLLVAVVRTPHEELRSGTWATVRYARRMKKNRYLFQPDGAIVVEMS